MIMKKMTPMGHNLNPQSSLPRYAISVGLISCWLGEVGAGLARCEPLTGLNQPFIENPKPANLPLVYTLPPRFLSCMVEAVCMEILWQDIRYAGRTLLKKSGFTMVVILTLALGIGANTTIFSLIYGILLRPFPYHQPEQLSRVETLDTKLGRTGGVAVADLEDMRAQNHSFTDIAAYMSLDAAMGINGPAELVHITWVTANLFPVLGISPIIGRAFLPEEDREGGDTHKILLGHHIWKNHFGSDPQIVGKQVELRHERCLIVGVMPPDFRFPAKTDLWAPYESWRSQWGRARAAERGLSYGRSAIGRLKSGVSVWQAQSDLDSIASDLQQRYPSSNTAIRTKLTPLRDAEAGDIRPYLLLLIGAVSFVLLIYCVNVASLLLADGAARRREIGVRIALGAGRRRIVQKLLLESILLSGLGGLVGIGLAFLGVRGLLALIPITLPFWMRIDVNGAVLLFSLAVSAGAGIISGLVPALKTIRVNLNEILKEGAKGSADRSHRRLHNSLVVMEVAPFLSGALLKPKILSATVKLHVRKHSIGRRRPCNIPDFAK
ncbi:MAG: ABC transporter permease [Chloracidobacterium sp.]|nr:ABC transporter permease [Chloracidobacterium sp.]